MFIAEAQEEWEEEQAVGVLDNIHKDSGSGKDSKDDRSEDMNKGDLHLVHPPVAFAWAYELKSGDASLKDKLEAGTPSDTKEAVEELYAAVGALEGMVEEAREGSRQDCLEIMQHVGLTTNELVDAINCINRRGQGWGNEIGDVSVLREDSGVHDLTLVDTVSKIIESLGESRRPSEDEDVVGSLEDLFGMVRAIDADLVKTYSQLNAKIKALERAQASGAGGTGTSPPPAALVMSTPILDAHGVCVATLGDVMQENVDLKLANTHLEQRLDRLAADITAQGGVVLGRHTSTSKLQLL